MSTDKILPPKELEKLLDKWQRTYGEERTNKQGMVYFHIADKITAMNALIQTLISLGYDEDDINEATLKSAILKIQTPHKWQKLQEWRAQVGKIWDYSINSVFPSKYELKEAKEPETIDKPEIVLKTPPIVETKKEQPAEPDFLNMPDTVKRSDEIGKPLDDERIDFDLMAELDKLDDE